MTDCVRLSSLRPIMLTKQGIVVLLSVLSEFFFWRLNSNYTDPNRLYGHPSLHSVRCKAASSNEADGLFVERHAEHARLESYRVPRLLLEGDSLFILCPSKFNGKHIHDFLIIKRNKGVRQDRSIAKEVINDLR